MKSLLLAIKHFSIVLETIIEVITSKKRLYLFLGKTFKAIKIVITFEMFCYLDFQCILLILFCYHYFE